MILIFQSNTVYFREIEKNKKDEYENIGFMEYKKLENVLRIENGYYVNYETEFKEIMKLTKKKFNLAFGLKADEANYIIYFRGYDIKLAFLIMENSEIVIEEKEF